MAATACCEDHGRPNNLKLLGAFTTPDPDQRNP